jgi:hypothetical protein
MTLNIPKKEWGNFFDDLTKRRFEWKTSLEVIGRDIGSQSMSEGLPLKGVTAEFDGDKYVVEILLGKDAEHHQTHNIYDPAVVAFLPNESDPGGILEIEESDGTKTLMKILEPMPIESGYGAYRVVHA